MVKKETIGYVGKYKVNFHLLLLALASWGWAVATTGAQGFTYVHTGNEEVK